VFPVPVVVSFEERDWDPVVVQHPNPIIQVPTPADWEAVQPPNHPLIKHIQLYPLSIVKSDPHNYFVMNAIFYPTVKRDTSGKIIRQNFLLFVNRNTVMSFPNHNAHFAPHPNLQPKIPLSTTVLQEYFEDRGKRNNEDKQKMRLDLHSH
jgi:hypothetical protein